MNAKKLIAAVAVFAAAGSAFAATDITGNFEDFTNVPSTKTRAEVIAELNQARAQHQLSTTAYVEPAKNFVSTKARTEVVAELSQARAQGQSVNTEWVEPTAMIAATNRTRAEVRAEAIQLVKSNGKN